MDIHAENLGMDLFSFITWSFSTWLKKVLLALELVNVEGLSSSPLITQSPYVNHLASLSPKVTTPNCKTTPIDSRLKCTTFVHKSLGSISDELIFSTLKILSLCIESSKLHPQRIWKPF